MAQLNFLGAYDLTKAIRFDLCPQSFSDMNEMHDSPSGVEGAQGWSIESIDGETGQAVQIIHMTRDTEEAVRILAQLNKETGKPVCLSTIYGMLPPNAGGLKELAEDLTTEIQVAIEEDEDERDDAFDHHPLAELRELCVDYSDYAGEGTAKCPYQTDLMEKLRVFVEELASFQFNVIDNTPPNAAPDEALEPVTDLAPVLAFHEEAEELADNWR